MNHKAKCKLCGEEIIGVGYRMPFLSADHLESKHPEWWAMYVKKRDEIYEKQEETGLWFGLGRI